jgi:VWFA-related protein
MPTRTASAVRRASAVLAAVVALAIGTAAQQPVPPATAAPGSADQTPAFRAGADLVIVDAVVVDRNGQPVTDLKASEFELKDEGRPQSVELFQTVSTAALPEAAQHQAQGATRRFSYSTNAGVDARPTRAFVLFFDDIHLLQADGDRAKAALRQFVDRELQDGDLVSLVAPGQALRWHARMPDGRPELERIIRGLKGLHAPDPSRDAMTEYEAYRISAFNDERIADQVDRRWHALRINDREPINLATDKGFQPENRGGNIGLIKQDILGRAAAVYQQAAARNAATLQAMARTIDGLAAVRGRKALVLLSPGFIQDQERLDQKRALDAARRANVAVYFVDARGLVASTPESQAANANTGGAIDSRDLLEATADITLGAEGAADLADATGGFSVRNQNDLGRGLARIGTESRVYYLLGFAPDRSGGRPGAFHKLEVKVTRPGVTVRARRGYYAGGVPGDPASSGASAGGAAPATATGARSKWTADGIDTLDRASESPYELADIPLRATNYVFGDATADTSLVMLAVDADLRAFAFGRKDGHLADVADLRMLTTELGTGTTERYERQVEMTFPATARFGAESWHTLAQEFRLKPGRYQARIALRDANSGRIGAVTHDFEVPALTGFRITTPILTDTLEAPSFGTAAPPKPVLVVRRSFPAGSTLYYQYSVLGAARDAAGAVKVVGSHELRGPGGAVVKQLAPRPIAAAADGGLSRLAGLNLTGVAAGDYELVLTVKDEIAGQVVERREPLTILPPEPLGGSAARQP